MEAAVVVAMVKIKVVKVAMGVVEMELVKVVVDVRVVKVVGGEVVLKIRVAMGVVEMELVKVMVAAVGAMKIVMVTAKVALEVVVVVVEMAVVKVVVMAVLAVAATRWCFRCIARAPHLFHIVSFVIQAATDNNHRALALPPRLISICPRLRALIYARRLSFACVRACDERVRVIAEPIHGHSLGYSLTRPRNMCSR